MRQALIAVLLLALALAGCVPTAAVAPAPALHAAALAPTPSPLEDLWLDISLGQPLVEWFDEIARPEDIARVEHPSQVGLLEPITNGRRLVVFKSLRDAQRGLEIMGDAFDIVGYNLESGPATPPDEQANPVAAVRIMQEIAVQDGKLVAIGPDRNFALTYGPQIAPYVDIFVIQVQRIQTEPDLVRAYVRPLAAALREANPDIQISMQVRTEGDVVALVDMIESVADSLDGVSILTSAETVDIAEALVDELRSRGPAQAPSPAPAPSQTPVPSDTPTPSPDSRPVTPTETAAVTAASTATGVTLPSPAATPTSVTMRTTPEGIVTVPRRTGVAYAAAVLVGAGAGALLVALIVRATRRP